MRSVSDVCRNEPVLVKPESEKMTLDILAVLAGQKTA